MFKNVRKEEITIPAQMSYLIQVREFIEHIGKKHKFDDRVVNSFKLVIDEACTNIIRHGYRDIKNGEVSIKAIIRRLSLTVVITDQGKSYDPRQANTPDLAKYVDIGKKGGLGILMMRKLMDDIKYSITERGNEFRLTKYREAHHESKALQWWNELNLRAKYSIYATAILLALISIIFTPLYLSIETDTEKTVLRSASDACQSLAASAREDLLDDNNIGLFEKAHDLQQTYESIIDEVLILGTDNNVLAWGNIGAQNIPVNFQMPENAVLLDTLGGVTVYGYALADTLQIFDLSADVQLAGVTVIGRVHIWVREQTIIDMTQSEKTTLLLLALGILFAGSVIIFLLIQKILAPFHSLAQWVRQVVHGKVDQDEIDIDASDELGEIAEAFNEMTTKFHEAQVTLVEQEKLQKELQVAQEIQQMLLPSDFPEVEGYEIASYYEAAKEVGGDLFDFVEVDDDTIGICVADVSGKGVPGSMIMTMIRTALRLESRGNKNPAEVLAKVNRFVAADMKRGMFVTMFYVVLDSRNRTIHYASAGHNPMMLYRGNTKQTYFLNPSGFPVGIQLPDLTLFDRKIETDTIRLHEDDILVLYTDGITEAMNVERELYREERFLDAIRKNAHLDVGEFIKSINSDIKGFTGGAVQNDDITFVAIKEKMMQGEVTYNIQKELTNLIDGGMKVKDALESLRVSQYFYYKYKDIIDKEGMAGLKQHLESQDYIEQKHISIEVKTKVFDIIRKNPNLGAERIVAELQKEEYGSIELSKNRLYQELIKLRLNTREMRKRYLEKGGKKRLKQPGTPLLTLDGNVILDFESSQQEVAKRRGSADKDTVRKLSESEEKKKEFFSESAPQEAESSTGLLIHKPARTFVSAEERMSKTKDSDAGKVDEKSKVERPKDKTPLTKEELLSRVSINVNQRELQKFYDFIKEDHKTVEDLLVNFGDTPTLAEDIKKTNTILHKILRTPQLKELNDVKRVFERVQHIVFYMSEQFSHIKKEDIVSGSKDLLYSLQKDNKFKDYSVYFETINKLGMIQRHLRVKQTDKIKHQSQDMDKVRKRLAKKEIVRSSTLLEVVDEDKKK